VKEKEEKVHWLQTPEGKKKMSRIQKKKWREKRATSKAETLVKKKVGKEAGVNRAAMYDRVAKVAVASGEVENLMKTVSHVMFLNMIGGGK
jgi:hypothetical protein